MAIGADFREKLVEAGNLGLLGRCFLRLPTAANRLRRNVSSDLQHHRFGVVGHPLLHHRFRATFSTRRTHKPPNPAIGPSYRHDRTLTFQVSVRSCRYEGRLYRLRMAFQFRRSGRSQMSFLGLS